VARGSVVPIMSAKADIMETMRAGIDGYRVAELPREVPRLDLNRIVLFEQIEPAPESRLWLELHAARGTAGQSWEGLGYLVLWFCGITGIGFSFL